MHPEFELQVWEKMNLCFLEFLNKNRCLSKEEIKEYCKKIKSNIDPLYFFDFYEGNGWKVGRNPMKDWQASIRTWSAKNKNQKSSNSEVGRILTNNNENKYEDTLW